MFIFVGSSDRDHVKPKMILGKIMILKTLVLTILKINKNIITELV